MASGQWLGHRSVLESLAPNPCALAPTRCSGILRPDRPGCLVTRAKSLVSSLLRRDANCQNPASRLRPYGRFCVPDPRAPLTLSAKRCDNRPRVTRLRTTGARDARVHTAILARRKCRVARVKPVHDGTGKLPRCAQRLAEVSSDLRRVLILFHAIERCQSSYGASVPPSRRISESATSQAC